MKIKITELIKFQLIAVFGILSLIIGMYCLFFYNLNEPLVAKQSTLGIAYTCAIFFHNMCVYLSTVVLFAVAPLPILYNWGVLAFTIAYNISAFGLEQTLYTLWPHGIAEVPTILLYQYLAFKMMLIFYRTHSLGLVLKFVKLNYRWYLVCVLLVLIGAILEGMIG